MCKNTITYNHHYDGEIKPMDEDSSGYKFTKVVFEKEEDPIKEFSDGFAEDLRRILGSKYKEK